MAEDDELWPQPDRVGRQVESLKKHLSCIEDSSQELEIVIGDEHISFTTSKIGSLVIWRNYIFLWAGNEITCLFPFSNGRPGQVDVNQSRDPDGLRCFYYLVQVRKHSLSAKSVSTT